MKKSLIALSVLAVSGAAFAQSSVTVYGLADVYFGSQKSAETGLRQTKLESSGIYQSRFGFKGSEDLGGGLKANFLLENGFQLDTGGVSAGQAFSRQSYVGLSGGFGEVKLGKMWTAYDDISGATQAALNSVLSPFQGVWLSSSYKDNPDNSIYYASPVMGGVSGAVSYSLGENKNTPTAGVDAGSIVSVHVKYKGGPVYAGAAYQTEKATGAVPATNFTRLNASYDLGVAKLLAGYGRVAFDGKSTNDWQLGADVPLSSAWLISGGVARSAGSVTGFTSDASYIGKRTDVTAAGQGDVVRTGYSLAASYDLSKRTKLYGGYHATKTKVPGAADAKGSLLAVGMLHFF
ncbi:porin [soil metagenome]